MRNVSRLYNTVRLVMLRSAVAVRAVSADSRVRRREKERQRKEKSNVFDSFSAPVSTNGMLIFVLSWNEPCMFGQGLLMNVKQFLFLRGSVQQNLRAGQ